MIAFFREIQIWWNVCHFKVMMPDDAIGAPITPVEHDIVLELWVVLGRSSDAMRNFFCVGVRTFLCNKESEE